VCLLCVKRVSSVCQTKLFFVPNNSLFLIPYFYFFFIMFSLGFGSVGTIVEGPFIAFVLANFGWNSCFYLMILLTFFSAIAIGKPAFFPLTPKGCVVMKTDV